LRASSGCRSGVLSGGSEEGLWRLAVEKLMGSLGHAPGTRSSSPGLGNLMVGSVVCSDTSEPVERRRELQRVGAREVVPVEVRRFDLALLALAGCNRGACASFVCVDEAFLELVEAVGVSCVMRLFVL
jgi:hypothetical protein